MATQAGQGREVVMAGGRDEGLRAAIEAAKQQYDRDNPPGPDVLPRNQWQVVPDPGHRACFTESEVAQAGAVFVSPAEAAQFARELYADEGPEAGFVLPEEVLNSLALLSESLAERVRMVLNETPEQAQARIGGFRERLARWRAQGSPPDDFPASG